MPKFYDSISPELAEWALEQPVFFVASAPLAGLHVNLSPKGLPSSTFAILGPNQCAYLDATGSGCETIAHIYENGRVTVMFCSFKQSPRIMRFFCKGRVIESDHKSFPDFLEKMGKGDAKGGAYRAVIVLDVYTCQTSCGFGVPLFRAPSPSDENVEESDKYSYDDRDTLSKWGEKQLKKGKLLLYQGSNNARSLDGLPGLKLARRANREWSLIAVSVAWIRRLYHQKGAVLVGVIIAILAELLVRALIRSPLWTEANGRLDISGLLLRVGLK